MLIKILVKTIRFEVENYLTSKHEVFYLVNIIFSKDFDNHSSSQSFCTPGIKDIWLQDMTEWLQLTKAISITISEKSEYHKKFLLKC